MLRSYIESDYNDRYKVIQATWRDDPDDRPTFTQLASIMGDFLEENVKQVNGNGKKGGGKCAIYKRQLPIIYSQACLKHLLLNNDFVSKPCIVLFWKLAITF